MPDTNIIPENSNLERRIFTIDGIQGLVIDTPSELFPYKFNSLQACLYFLEFLVNKFEKGEIKGDVQIKIGSLRLLSVTIKQEQVHIKIYPLFSSVVDQTLNVVPDNDRDLNAAGVLLHFASMTYSDNLKIVLVPDSQPA